MSGVEPIVAAKRKLGRGGEGWVSVFRTSPRSSGVWADGGPCSCANGGQGSCQLRRSSNTCERDGRAVIVDASSISEQA